MQILHLTDNADYSRFVNEKLSKGNEEKCSLAVSKQNLEHRSVDNYSTDSKTITRLALDIPGKLFSSGVLVDSPGYKLCCTMASLVQ